MHSACRYEAPWQRLGLEAVFGEIISFPPAADARRKHGIIKQFIMDRLVKNNDLRRKFKRTAEGADGKEHTVAVGNYAMVRVFMLVYFLDQAHDQQLIPHQIRLFRRKAQFKSSKALLETFAKDFIQVRVGRPACGVSARACVQQQEKLPRVAPLILSLLQRTHPDVA